MGDRQVADEWTPTENLTDLMLGNPDFNGFWRLAEQHHDALRKAGPDVTVDEVVRGVTAEILAGFDDLEDALRYVSILAETGNLIYTGPGNPVNASTLLFAVEQRVQQDKARETALAATERYAQIVRRKLSNL